MEDHSKRNETLSKEMCSLAQQYSKWIEDEMKKSKQEMVVSNIGKLDPKRHLQEVLNKLINLYS